MEPPDIDEGSGRFVISNSRKRAKIGTRITVFRGTPIIIDCNIASGTPPINITWFRNGSPYPTEGSTSSITITDPRRREIFKCRADNIAGFDIESSRIFVTCGKCTLCMYMYIRTCMYKPYIAYICIIYVYMCSLYIYCEI